MSDIQNKRGTYARWMELDPILLEGEIGFIIEDTLPGANNSYKDKFKIGDGIKPFSQLPFQSAIGDLTNITSISAPNTIQMNTAYAGGSTAEGQLAWNQDDRTLEFKMGGGNVTQQIGQEQLVLVKHADNTGLIKGKVVYITGSDGSNTTVRYAQGNSELASSETIGVMTESVSGGGKGFATTFGIVHDIDTSALTEGAIVWLDPTIAGGMTTTKPLAPNHAVQVGYCIRKHAVNGHLFVRPQNGYELYELHDVSITSPAAGQILARNAENTLWTNQSASTAGIVALTGDQTIGGTKTFTESVIIGGNLTVNGTTTTINTSDLSITDPMIYLGESNPSNSLDLGLVTSFNNGTYQHSGLVRDATDGKWKLFSGVIPEPTTTVDFSSATYDPLKIGPLEATALTVSSVSATGLISSNTLSVANTTTLSGEIKVGSVPTAGINKQVLTSKGPGTSAEWTTLQAGVQALEVAPTSPAQGDTWFNTITGQLLVYYDTYWVEVAAGAQGPTGPTGPMGPNYTLTATSPLSVTGPTYSQTISAALATSTTNGLISGTVDQTIGGNKTFDGNVVISGNFTVNGTTTNLNSTNLVIEDKNIILADVATPTDTTADGAGITIKGATDKTFNWVSSTGLFNASHGISAPNISSSGDISAATFTGSGANLTGYAANLTVGGLGGVSDLSNGTKSFTANTNTRVATLNLTDGLYAIRIAFPGDGGNYWSTTLGGLMAITSANGQVYYNSSPSSQLSLNSTQHYRTVGLPSFYLYSDNSAGNYGYLSLYANFPVTCSFGSFNVYVKKLF